MEIALNVVVALVILIGLGGALTQVYPGPLLVLAAVAAWAVLTGGTAAWVALAVAAVAIVVTGFGKYVLVGRRLTRAGVPGRSLLVGGVVGVLGFFAVPVIGLPLGFTLGVYLWELQRLGQEPAARAAAWEAVKAQGLAIVLELGGCLVAATAWVVALAVG
ncbi:DUF456 family protein [Actinomyces howellii]|uniref:Protein of uncharacterized function (DUF456) n=1 Tax=Actinomyces howellii TaxID=52771 RepID=A0A3S4SMD2_9ACTO|nr:DUF456 family protein [Actinomyces howellii]VEG27369.1 Protein of uncharacterised function (DUF456) [Actinomyces howellii]